MGDPLNVFLSELYLTDYEKSPFIKKYFRYVDDTLILFRGTNRQEKIL